MIVELKDIGKKFNRRWIFKDISETIAEGSRLAIVGRNGSGKSTLLKIIGGFLTPSKGSVDYTPNQENNQLTISFAAPYQHLMEEFTLIEHLHFHAKFRKPVISFDEMMTQSGLESARDEVIGGFSSGMLQRLRLCLAFFFDARIILLDEPTSNLDDAGMQWYQQLIESTPSDKSIIIASNQPIEYKGFEQEISINNHIP